MPGSDGQELVNPLLESGGVLLPQQVMKKNPHGVHAHGFGPSELGIDFNGIECHLLPHLELVDGRLGNVITSQQPWLLHIPGIRLFFRPTCGLPPERSRREDEGEKHSCNESECEVFHFDKTPVHLYALRFKNFNASYLSAWVTQDGQ
jgi:hypothetical protein